MESAKYRPVLRFCTAIIKCSGHLRLLSSNIICDSKITLKIHFPFVLHKQTTKRASKIYWFCFVLYYQKIPTIKYLLSQQNSLSAYIQAVKRRVIRSVWTPVLIHYLKIEVCSRLHRS